MERKAVSLIMLMSLLMGTLGLAHCSNFSSSKREEGTQTDEAPDFGTSSASTAFSEGFEGTFPADNWLVQDITSNNGLDYWDDTSYRSQAGSWSGWCAQVGTQTTTTTVLSENFEGVFPGSWTVEDFNSASGNDLWDDTSYRSHDGSWSAWCAETGTKGQTTPVFYEDFEGAWPGSWIVGDWNPADGLDYWGDYYDTTHPAHQGSYDGWCNDEGYPPEFYWYDNNMDAYMYRNVSLSGYSSVTLSYWYWLNCETNYDYLEVMYYSGGSWYYSDLHTGNISVWQHSSASIPTSAIYVGLLFHSDASVINYAGGAFVDQVQLTGQVPNNSVHEYDNDMEAYMYHYVSLSGYSSVTLSYWYWLNCEGGWDNLYVTYFDTSWHDIDPHTGNSGGWLNPIVPIPTSAIYVGFHFSSDTSVCSYEGAYIDQVTLSGVADIPNNSLHTYDDYMDARMVRKYTMDASSWASANLYYWAWYQTESGYDYCQVIVTGDGGTHWYQLGEQLTGSSGWSYHTLSIPDAYLTSLFNIGFVFHSDGSIHYEGVYLDGIVFENDSTIYIHADGSVDPPTAPIQRNENLYTLTDNIYSSASTAIVIEKNGITLDGAGHTIQGSSGTGIELYNRTDVTIKNAIIKSFSYGIYLFGSSNNFIQGDTITDNQIGVWVSESSSNTLSSNLLTRSQNYSIVLNYYSSYNTFTGNNITDNNYGVRFWYSPNNFLSGNSITANDGTGVWFADGSSNNTLIGSNIADNHSYGIKLEHCSNNRIYHNNLANNSPAHVTVSDSSNFWDEGYPSGGNHWSDYSGLDLYKGTYQNETGSDGIGDTPYIIVAGNRDNYPLIGAWTPHSTQYAWSMFRHDLAHTSYSDSPTSRTNRKRWSSTTGNNVLSSPAIADGKVYVGSYDGRLYCYTALNGTLVWSYPAGGAIGSSPAVADSKVYVASNDGNVYCIDASSGAYVWNYSIGVSGSSPAVVNGKVYVGSTDGRVYCLDSSTGACIWSLTTGTSVYSSPAIVGDKVYVGSYDFKVYCIDASTGAHVWNYTTGAAIHSSPAVVDGKVYVGSMDNKVYCLSASTGAYIWSYVTDGPVPSSPAVAYGKVYIGSYDFKVHCIDASNGEYVWSYLTGSYVYSSPALADGKVYFGSADFKVYCLDASTGGFIWNYTTDGYVFSSPSIADGDVFIGSNDGAVYAFGDIIKVPEDYPTVQAAVNAASTGDTILVAPGVYHECVIITNKTLTILGEKGSGSTFIGGGTGTAFTISGSGTSGTNIAQVTIISYGQGVSVDNSAQCRIFDNIMYSMTDSGIAVKGSSAVNTLIYNNIFQNNLIAINLTQSSASNTIYGNTISSNNIGILLKSGGNTIYANTISKNNYGIKLQSSNDNSIYWNNFDNIFQEVDIQNSICEWDADYPMGGNYWGSDYLGTDFCSGPTPQTQPGRDGIGDTPYTVYGDVQDHYPLIKPFGGSHDICILQVACSKTIVGQGYSMKIEVTILDCGIYTETRNIKIYANSIVTAGQDVILPYRSCTTLTFTWETSGFAKSDYNIKAYATPVTGDDCTVDNTLTDGTVKVVTPGDVNADGIVDVVDAGGVSAHWCPGPPLGPLSYDPNYDIDDDGAIGILDAAIVSAYWTGPPKGPLDP